MCADVSFAAMYCSRHGLVLTVLDQRVPADGDHRKLSSIAHSQAIVSAITAF